MLCWQWNGRGGGGLLCASTKPFTPRYSPLEKPAHPTDRPTGIMKQLFFCSIEPQPIGMLLSLLFQRPKQAPSAEKSRNSSSHREHRTFRYKDKPSAHTVQRTSPSPYVTGPCCHVLRVTHQTDFSSDRSEFSLVITANPRRHHCR